MTTMAQKLLTSRYLCKAAQLPWDTVEQIKAIDPEAQIFWVHNRYTTRTVLFSDGSAVRLTGTASGLRMHLEGLLDHV